jgi:hypothetical protein
MAGTSRLRVLAATGGVLAVVGMTAFAVQGLGPAAAADPAGSMAAAAPQAADAPPAAVEDGVYPGAAAILAEHNVRVIAGDGHILYADCALPPVGNVGVMKVRTTEEIGPDGAGLICFKVTGRTGRLDLEVPAVYEIRGDGLRTGSGHGGTADVRTDDGEHTTVTLNPSGSVQVGIGADPNNEPTTLVRLRITD